MCFAPTVKTFLCLIISCFIILYLVPGIGGSQIEAKLSKNASSHYWCYKKYENWFTVWLSIEELLPWSRDCWMDNLK